MSDLRDHSRPCEHGWSFEHWLDGPVHPIRCSGSAPVEGERIQWCKTHSTNGVGPEAALCWSAVVVVTAGHDTENPCVFVPALIVEVDDE